ncbi:MAG: hypothetical protein LBI17_04080, partial [Rickettsiales bacterium]|nr:hypothetical protein [Rickettsiales bacterium]
MRLFKIAIAGIAAGIAAEFLHSAAAPAAPSKGGGASAARAGSRASGGSSARLSNPARRGTGGTRATGVSAGGALLLASGSGGNVGGKKDCRMHYSDCMDAQIPGIIGRYSYLSGDKAIELLLEGIDPFRCLYYNSKSVEKLFGVVSSSDSTKKVAVGASSADRTLARFCTPQQVKDSKDESGRYKTNFCLAQRDMNELYLLYNYYCKISEQMGPTGVMVNLCETKDACGDRKSCTFATKDSRAFFVEAKKRIDSGTLKILNLDQTEFYRNRILPMIACDQLDGADKTNCEKNGANTEKRLENWKQYHLDSTEMTDIFNGLGLDSESEIFSINIAPPAGSSSLDSASVFVRASDLCFSGTTLSKTNKELYGSSSTQIQESINKLKNCGEQASRNDLERYYLAGTWVKECEDGYQFNSATNLCVSTDDPNDKVKPYTAADFEAGDAPLAETEFMSAKKSCGQYEQILITTRDQAYGDFDTKFKGYLYDNVAKLIEKHTEDMSKIGTSLNSLVELDAQISINNAELDALKYTTKQESLRIKAEARSEFELAMAEIMEESHKSHAKLNEMFGKINSAQMMNVCSDMARSFSSVDKDNLMEFVGLKVLVKYIGGDTIGSISKDGKGKQVQNSSFKRNLVFDDHLDDFDKGLLSCTDIPGFDFSGLMPDGTQFGDCQDVQLSTNGSLPAGIYKILLTGAGGGGGGRSYGGG